MLSSLTATLQQIHVTDGFSEVLDNAQLDVTYCAALVLSAAVTEYLAQAVLYLMSDSLGMSFFSMPI